MRNRDQLDVGRARTTLIWWWSWFRDLVAYGRERAATLGLSLFFLAGLAAALVALWLFAEVVDGVMEQETGRIDRAVLELLRQIQSPSLDQIALAITLLGSEAVIVLAIVLLVVFGMRQRWDTVAGLLLTAVGANALNSALKAFFQRTRPSPVEALISAQEFSFPSGHAMVSAAFYLYLAYLGWCLLGGIVRVLWVAGCAILVGLIGLTRLYLGVHFLTDVVAGYLAGFVWTVAVIVGVHLLSLRRAAGE